MEKFRDMKGCLLLLTCTVCLMQDPLSPGNAAATIIDGIRKRKGLKPDVTPLSEYEDRL